MRCWCQNSPPKIPQVITQLRPHASSFIAEELFGQRREAGVTTYGTHPNGMNISDTLGWTTRRFPENCNIYLALFLHWRLARALPSKESLPIKLFGSVKMAPSISSRFARHRFGCRILCRLLEHCTTEGSTQRRAMAVIDSIDEIPSGKLT